MTDFDPGPFAETHLINDDSRWTLIFVRELDQGPGQVWTALTQPDELDQWAPFAATEPLTAPGRVTLTLINGDARTDIDATITRVVAPELLEYTWGDDLLRWELEPSGGGTRLTLRHTLARPDTATMAAAGWHLCVEVLNRLLNGKPVGVIRGRDAMNYGWEDLRTAYGKVIG